MKHLQLLFVLILFPVFANAQLVFELNSPASERGVFPCMAGAPTEWVNSPNLYQNGNWYSDTLELANDGISGSACSPLSNTINSNFALFYRSGCDLSQSLLNAQNAGATGAIVIDSVDGRPLEFDPGVSSGLITIPFVIISKVKGDSMVQRILSNNDVVVSFGEKSGANTVDVGIYKEYSLWSRYGIFPFEYYKLPDEQFGTWVYNRGTTDVNNLQVKLWFYHNDLYPQHNVDSLSSPFDLPAGDSVFVNFDFEYDHVNDGFSIDQADPITYGYELVGITDDDTLDNNISMIIYSEGDLISNSYSSSEFNTDFSEVDYFIEGSPLPIDSIGYCLYMPFKYEVFDGVFCAPVFPLVQGLPGSEQVLYIRDVSFMNQQAYFGPAYAGSFYYGEPQTDTIYAEPFFLNSEKMSSDRDIVASLLIVGSNQLGFSSDMYHDEHIRQGNLPTYFRKDLFAQDSAYQGEFLLTPILSFTISPNPPCFIGSVDELQSDVISIVPNPASDIISISSSETIQTILIFDMLGNQVATFDGENQFETAVNVEQLKRGCYILRSLSQDGQMSVERFILE
jgi:hypothetical protein